MKKNFMKKLATTVALALTVTTIVPGSGVAQAAGAQSLSANKVTLYKGSAYDFNVKNSSSAYKYTYTSADKGVATVNSKTGLVSAKTNGATKISCKIVNKKTNKAVKTLSATVTVVNKMAVNTNEITLNEQETFDINMNKAITSVYSYRYATSDASVATVTSTTGIVTGVKEGTATVTITVTNKSTKKSNKITVPVTIKAGKVRLVKAEQTHLNKVVLTLAGPDEDLKTKPATEDIVIKDSYGVPNYVKEVAYDAAKKTATVTTYTDFANDAKYTVTYKETSTDFTAKVGEAARVVLENQTIQAGTPTKIKIKVFDANGIDITTDDELKKISISMDTDNGYINDDGATKEITLYNIGGKATVTAKYNTGKFNDTGVETTFESNKVVVNAVEKLSAVVKFVAHTAVKGDVKPNWDKVNHTIPLDSTDYKLKIKATNADGDVLTDEVSYESKDTNVLTVDSDGTLYPQKTGTAYVKVTINEVSQVVSVSVGKEAVLSALVVDKSSVTVSNVAAAKDVQVVKATARDQYGNDISGIVDFTQDADSKIRVEPKDDGIYHISTTADKGTITAKLTAEYNGTKLTRTVSVKSVSSEKEAKDTKTYKPVFSTNAIDLGEGENKVTVRVDGLDSSGVKIVSPDIKKIQFKAPNGQVYEVKGAAKAATGSAVEGLGTVTGSALIAANFTEDDAHNVSLFFGDIDNNKSSAMLGNYTVTLFVADQSDPKKDDKQIRSTINVKNSAISTPSITLEKSGTEDFAVNAATPETLGKKFFSAKVDGDSYDVALNDFVVENGKDGSDISKAGSYTIKVKSLSLTDGDTQVIFAYARTLRITVK